MFYLNLEKGAQFFKLILVDWGCGVGLVVSRVDSLSRGPGFDACYLNTFSGEPAVLKFARCQAKK